MTTKNKERLKLALLNAAEFIRSHAEAGLDPEDVNEENEQGLDEYVKACDRAAKKIENIAIKLNIKDEN